MAMKNIILVMISIFSLASCVGFLKEDPKTTPTPEVAYRTPAGLEACLRGSLNTVSSTGMYLHSMMRYIMPGSCLIANPSGKVGASLTDPSYLYPLSYTQGSQVTYNNDCYYKHYQTINNCNEILFRLEDSPVDEAYKTEIAAEARFYRAVFYFALVRFYGDVPIRTEVSTLENVDTPRAPYYKVYEQILEDLIYAEENMRSAERVQEVSPGEGRPHKWAATAFKAAVFLQIACILEHKDDNFFDCSKEGRTPDFSALSKFQLKIEKAKDAYELAYNTAVDVIENSGYELCPDYSQLFRWTNPEDWQLTERIFTLQVSSGCGYGQLAHMTLPQFVVGSSNYTLENSASGRVRPTRFVFQKWCETYPGERGTGSYNSNIYVSSSDPRMDASLYYESYQSQQNYTESSVKIYPYNSRVRTNSRSTFLPYFKKYLDPKYNVSANPGNWDYYYMRFAEVYLIAAEAAAGLCTNPDDTWGKKAYQYVEYLHARARGELTGKSGEGMPKWENGRFSTRDELIEGIFWERIFEMHGEGHEWWDTHRRGANWFCKVIIDPLNTHLQEDEQTEMREWYGSEFLYPTDNPTIRHGLLLEFPYEEVMYNSEITTTANDF